MPQARRLGALLLANLLACQVFYMSIGRHSAAQLAPVAYSVLGRFATVSKRAVQAQLFSGLVHCGTKVAPLRLLSLGAPETHKTQRLDVLAATSPARRSRGEPRASHRCAI